MNFKKYIGLTLVFLLLLVGCQPEIINTINNSNEEVVRDSSVFDKDINGDESTENSDAQESSIEDEILLKEDEYYYSVEDVSLYIKTFNKLPSNYITKNEAKDMGWEADDNSGLVVGGDYFGNREGLLPDENGRKYFEADISDGYTHHRGPKRLVYSNDGLIFYTEDHYETFTKLY